MGVCKVRKRKKKRQALGKGWMEMMVNVLFMFAASSSSFFLFFLTLHHYLSRLKHCQHSPSGVMMCNELLQPSPNSTLPRSQYNLNWQSMNKADE